MIWVAKRRCRRVDLDDFTLTSWFARDVTSLASRAAAILSRGMLVFLGAGGAAAQTAGNSGGSSGFSSGTFN
jgi:hypothetical protein